MITGPIVLTVAAVLFLLNVVSLLQANEGVRGAGRIAYGLSTSLAGVYICITPASSAFLAYGVGGIFIAGGLVVAGLGARKYARRNQPQGS